ncbi:UPF0046 protein C25E10.12-like [Littorina saxatilis]|uniref:Calcineurin-like phosphoesterase domain-containing protein n=1 Tax=Littorina saxatilis TaxID=31220 RepID=A0AAN9C013_9CAEN
MFNFKSEKKKKNGDPNGQDEIQVDKETDKPTTAWERLREFHPCHQLPIDMYLQRPPDTNSLRFICMSDTHGAAENERREYHKRIPDGDVLIHSGDFSMAGDPSEIMRFDNFMSKLPHPVKLVIAGNHELTFEDNNHGTHPTLLRQKLGLPIQSTEEEVVVACKDLLQHLLYLQDETLTICGINIYCTPWVPQFGSWAFSVRRGENLLEVWNKIPSDTDILVTHSPPCGYGDTAEGDNHAGCVELLNTVVKRVKPKFHVFGHIHSGYGMWTNKTTTFINSSVCSNKYKPDNDPIVFDLPLPKGYSRSDFAELSTEKLRQARKISSDKANEGCCEERRDSLETNGAAQYSAVQKELLEKRSAYIDEIATGMLSVRL